MSLVLPVALALVAATSFVSGIFGVAGGLILMGGLVYLLPVSQAMIVHGLAQFVSNGARVVFWRRYVAIGLTAKFSAACVLTLGAFWFVRFVPSKPFVLFALGFSTVVLFFVPDRLAPRITQKGVPYFCGVLGTALMLVAGVSGPFLDQFFVRADLDRRVTIATKAAMQCVSHVAKVVYFGFVVGAGLDRDLWVLMAAVPVASVLGSSAATRILERMTDRQFYWWTRRIVLTLGFYYLFESARAWVT